MAEKLSGSFGSAAKSGRVPTHPICSWWGLAYCKYDLGCGHSGFVGEDDSLPPNTEYEPCTCNIANCVSVILSGWVLLS